MVRMLIVVDVVGQFAIDCNMFHFFSLLKMCCRNSPFVIATINFSPVIVYSPSDGEEEERKKQT